jgi:DNA helicase-2/ATP-dependent DNA helicase PcrA
MVALLREDEVVAQRYQRWFEFVLVDEFQDTNTAQYELVRHFGQPQGNVFVVGDEDQSIYAFRGADYRNVLQFRQDYPDAQIVLLEQNYRSTQNVLDAARAVIDKNPQRTPKALFTDRVGGTRLNVHEAYDERYEAGYVIETITRLRDDNPYDFNDFAVMYRTNAQSRALEEACVREGIPYRLVGGVGFYKRREVRDLLAYLRLVNNPNDKVSFSRIINVPKRGIGKKSLKDFQFWAAQADLTYDDALARLMAGEETPLSGRAAKQFATFGVMLAEWRAVAETGNLIELFDQIVSGNGYSMYLHEISDTPDQAMERSENVRELRGLVAEASDNGVLLADFLAEQALVSDVDELTDEANTITLLTLHSAKGLEFPVVFITGLEEGLLPHIRSFDDVEAMYEERRLMYVGLTRAKDQVCLTYAFRRMMWGSSNANTPSRFLSDIPIDLTEGVSSPIRHAADRQRFQRETSWEPSRLDRDLSRQTEQGQTNKLRGKIIPFGGMSPPQSRFRSGQSVSHPTFGEGLVIEIKHAGDDEEVTVAFANKKHGIKTIDANFLTLAES